MSFASSCIEQIDCIVILDLRVNLDNFSPFLSFLTGYVVNSLTECLTLYEYHKIRQTGTWKSPQSFVIHMGNCQ